MLNSGVIVSLASLNTSRPPEQKTPSHVDSSHNLLSSYTGSSKQAYMYIHTYTQEQLTVQARIDLILNASCCCVEELFAVIQLSHDVKVVQSLLYVSQLCGDVGELQGVGGEVRL